MKKVIAIATMLSFGLIGAVPMTAVAAPKDKTPALDFPVVGTASNGGAFQGTAEITSFAVDGNNVVAIGTISGLVNGTQSIVSTFSAVVGPPQAAGAATPTAQPAAGCQILNLVLGPINLNVLGLVVSIPNPVVLNITAVPGAGNLLGNLLCSVTNLLNGGGAVQQIADLLNQILGILNGL